MGKITTEENTKYVIASLTDPTYYLRYIVQGHTYGFSPTIEHASKFSSRDIADYIISGYNLFDTGMEVVTIPVRTTYELINEVCDEK